MRVSEPSTGFFQVFPNANSFFCVFSKGALVYEQLGYKAFGMPGKLAASISITMQNIGGERLRHFNSKGEFVFRSLTQL